MKNKFILITVFAFTFLLSIKSYSTIITSATTGNWSVTTTWVGGVVPVTADSVVIAASHAVTVDGTYSCAHLTLQIPTPFSFTNTRIIMVGNSLTVNGDAIMNGSAPGATENTDIIVANTSTFTITGNLSLISTSSSTCILNLSVGTGNIVNLAGDLIINTAGTLSPGIGSTLNLNGTTSQTLNISSSVSLNDITVNNTSADGAILGNAITTSNVLGSITVESGTFNNGGFAINGNSGEIFQVNNGARFLLTGTSSYPTGFGTNTLQAGSFVDYGGGTQNVNSITYSNLLISATGTKTAIGNIVVNDSLAISAGTLNVGVNSLTGTGDLVMTGGELQLGRLGTPLPVLTGTNLLTAGDITFNGAGAQTIESSITYNNLNIAGSGVKSLEANSDINGNLTITSTLDVTASNFQISLAGDFVNNGTFTQQSGTVLIDGNALQDIGGSTTTTFNRLFFTNTSTVSTTANIIVTDSISITNTIVNIGTNSLTGTGRLSMTSGELQLGQLSTTIPALTGTYNLTGGNINFNGAGNQTISSTVTYNNLLVTGSGIKSLTGNTDVNGNILINAGTLAVTASNYQINLAGNWTNNASFAQQNGKVVLDGGNAQVLNSLTTFFHLEIANTSGGISITSGGGNMVTISDTLTTTNGTLTTNGNLTLQSNASGTSMVIPGSGNVSGNVIYQRYFTGSTDAWHLFSPTVSGETLEGYNDDLYLIGMTGGDAGGTTASFLTYDETLTSTTDPDTGWVGFTTTAAGMSRGLGYLGYIYSTDLPATLDLTGPITTTSHSWTLSYTNSGDVNNDGWNLVGNPYPFPIDWDAASGWTRTGMAATMHYYEASIGDYRGYNHVLNQPINSGVQYLPSHQGFWVQATSGANSFQATNAIRSTASDPDFYKTQTNNVPTDMKTIKLGLTQSNLALANQELIINFFAEASETYESNYDSYQLRSYSTQKAFFTTFSDNKNLAINSYPNLVKQYKIPLYIDVTNDSNYTIRLKEISNKILQKVCGSISITDTAGNVLMDLKTDTAYTFKLNPDTTNTSQATFYLVIDPATLANFSTIQDTFSLGNVDFTNTSSASTAYNWDFGDGQQSIATSPSHTFNTPGTYTIRLIASNGTCLDTIYKTIVVNSTTGIETTSDLNQLSIFPNPTNGNLYISFDNTADFDNLIFALYDILGKQITRINSKNINNQSIIIDMNDYVDGVYFLKITDNNSTITRKVVLNK